MCLMIFDSYNNSFSYFCRRCCVELSVWNLCINHFSSCNDECTKRLSVADFRCIERCMNRSTKCFITHTIMCYCDTLPAVHIWCLMKHFALDVNFSVKITDKKLSHNVLALSCVKLKVVTWKDVIWWNTIFALEGWNSTYLVYNLRSKN